MILTNEKLVQPKVPNDTSPEAALSKDLAIIPQVRHVMIEHTEGPLFVWIAVDNPEPEVRERIYQKELEIITCFPEVDFDFNLIPSLGSKAAEIATGAQVVYSRPE